MTWDNLKSQNWGQTSLVRSGYKYQNLFNKNIWKGNDKGGGTSLNGIKLQTFLNKHQQKDQMKKVLCPWYPNTSNWLVSPACRGAELASRGNSSSRLSDFLRSESAQQFFDSSSWRDYGKGWKYVALLSLLEMWSTDLMQVNFDGIEKIFNHNEEGFKLTPFMNGKGKILYLQQGSAGGENNLSKITYHSGGMWTVRLCSNNNGCSSEEGLNLTMGDGRFCIVTQVCFSEKDEKRHIQDGKERWRGLRSSPSDTGFWATIVGRKSGTSLVRALFVSLVSASFEDMKNVSLAVQKPSMEGREIFTQLNNEK